MNKIEMPMWDDFHLHLRDGEMLENMAPLSAEHFARAVFMPNLDDDPILTGAQAVDCRRRIVRATGGKLEPLMTIQITPQTTPRMVRDAKRAGVVAGKIYPLGMTTNSENGVLDYKAPLLRSVYRAMEDLGMLLLLHGEHPKSKECLDREREFHSTVIHLSQRFPRLKIVFEHITNAESIELVEGLENVGATVTVHHLFLSLNDVIGGKLKPHNFCKPVAKKTADRDALVRAVLNRTPKIFLGTDSAPHLRGRKECADGCAGVFTAPVAMALLVDLFDGKGKLGSLEHFTSVAGAEFYGLPRIRQRMTLRRKEWTVPEEYSGVVPFMAGQTLQWKRVS